MLAILKDETRTARLIFFTISFLFIAAITLRQIPNWGDQLITSDGRGYFAHLPSILVDGDIDYYDNMGYLGLPKRNQWTIGTAISWSPFYLVGLLITRIGVALGQPWPLNGMAFPEQLLCCWGTVVYGAAAVALSYRTACRWFHPYWSFLGTTLFFSASNLPYYLVAEPYMSHGVSAFWSALLLYISIKDESLSWKQWALVGLLAGMAALTRPQDGLFLAVPFLWHVLRRCPWKELLFALLTTGLISALLFSVQVVIWKHGLEQERQYQITRSDKVLIQKEVHPSKVVTGGRLVWTRPRFAFTLFSPRCGLILWHPIYALGWLGLFLLLVKKPRVAATFLLATLIQTYIISVWGGQGATFGGRMFLGAFSSFNLGLVALLSEYGKRVRVATTVVGLVLVLEALFILIKHRMVAHTGNFSPKFFQVLNF